MPSVIPTAAASIASATAKNSISKISIKIKLPHRFAQKLYAVIYRSSVASTSAFYFLSAPLPPGIAPGFAKCQTGFPQDLKAAPADKRNLPSLFAAVFLRAVPFFKVPPHLKNFSNADPRRFQRRARLSDSAKKRAADFCGFFPSRERRAGNPSSPFGKTSPIFARLSPCPTNIYLPFPRSPFGRRALIFPTKKGKTPCAEYRIFLFRYA